MNIAEMLLGKDQDILSFAHAYYKRHGGSFAECLLHAEQVFAEPITPIKPRLDAKTYELAVKLQELDPETLYQMRKTQEDLIGLIRYNHTVRSTMKAANTDLVDTDDMLCNLECALELITELQGC